MLILTLIAGVGITFAALSVTADDATHTTSLSVSCFDFGEGDESALVAAITSTDLQDQTWHVTWFVTPPGASEALFGLSSISRADGETSGLTTAMAISGLNSGDSVRALFETRDSAGSVLFSFNRTVTVP